MPAARDLEYTRLFTCSTVDQAPASVGLYAWYGILDVGPPDWVLDLEGGVDIGIERFRAALRRQSMRFLPSAIELKGHGPFSTNWSGTLESDAEGLVAVLEGGKDQSPDGDAEDEQSSASYHGRRAPKLREATAAPDLRAALVRTLQAATPVLTAPLYVGVAESLRDRLSRHHSTILKESARVLKEPARRETIAESPQFGARAVAAGFSVDNLVVWTIDLETALKDVPESHRRRVVAEAAEWLLNRWHRPLLGRR